MAKKKSKKPRQRKWRKIDEYGHVDEWRSSPWSIHRIGPDEFTLMTGSSPRYSDRVISYHSSLAAAKRATPKRKSNPRRGRLPVWVWLAAGVGAVWYAGRHVNRLTAQLNAEDEVLGQPYYTF